MKILTIRGQNSAGKSTFLSIGAAGLIKLDIGKARRQEKTRVLLVTATPEDMRHLTRLFDSAAQSMGIIGCSSGEHGCFIQHHVVLNREDRYPNLLEHYDYVIADHPRWPELFAWVRRNAQRIRHLVASEWAETKEEAEQQKAQLEELEYDPA